MNDQAAGVRDTFTPSGLFFIGTRECFARTEF